MRNSDHSQVEAPFQHLPKLMIAIHAFVPNMVHVCHLPAIVFQLSGAQASMVWLCILRMNCSIPNLQRSPKRVESYDPTGDHQDYSCLPAQCRHG